MSRSFAYGLYAGMALLFAAQFAAQRMGLHVPWVHAYLDDLLCMPLMLFPVLLLFRRRFGEGYTFPPVYLILTWVALCMVFEIIVPLRNPHFTADDRDMLCYGLGGVLFWGMQYPFMESQESGTKSQDGYPKTR